MTNQKAPSGMDLTKFEVLKIGDRQAARAPWGNFPKEVIVTGATPFTVIDDHARMHISVPNPHGGAEYVCFIIDHKTTFLVFHSETRDQMGSMIFPKGTNAVICHADQEKRIQRNVLQASLASAIVVLLIVAIVLCFGFGFV